MKKILLAITLAAVTSLGVSQPAQAQPLPNVAQNLKFNLDYLYDLSIRVGDYGYALNDLGNFRIAAERFSYTLSHQDYTNLRYSYDASLRSWTYLRSYGYERQRFSDAQRDMSIIINTFERPLPPIHPPGPRVITVTGSGGGQTNYGDRNAACFKATDRALFSVAQACSAQRGNLLNSNAGSCGCSRVRGDTYNCRVQAQGACEVPGYFSLHSLQ